MSYLCTVLGNLNEWHIQFSLPIRRTYRLFYEYYSFPDEFVLVQKTEHFVIHLDYCTFKILQLKISRIIPNQRSFFSLPRNLSFATYNVVCKESSIIFRIFLTLLAFPFVQKLTPRLSSTRNCLAISRLSVLLQRSLSHKSFSSPARRLKAFVEKNGNSSAANECLTMTLKRGEEI